MFDVTKIIAFYLFAIPFAIYFFVSFNSPISPNALSASASVQDIARFMAVKKVIFTACPILEMLGGVGEVVGLRVVGFIQNSFV